VIKAGSITVIQKHNNRTWNGITQEKEAKNNARSL
jgi:hypothetical protein